MPSYALYGSKIFLGIPFKTAPVMEKMRLNHMGHLSIYKGIGPLLIFPHMPYMVPKTALLPILRYPHHANVHGFIISGEHGRLDLEPVPIGVKGGVGVILSTGFMA